MQFFSRITVVRFNFFHLLGAVLTDEGLLMGLGLGITLNIVWRILFSAKDQTRVSVVKC